MKSKKKRYFFIVLYLAFIVGGCAKKDEVKILKLAHGHDQLHPVHLSMMYMVEMLDSLSKGTLKINVYPNAQLGKERELIELLQIGMVDICKVSAAIIENFDPDYQIFSYPYLFYDRDHFFRILQGETGRQLLDQVDRYLLYGLTYYDAGSRCLYTVDDKVESPADLQGLKIRVMQNNTSIKMAKALGASPTPIAQAELYTALQQGVVDGAENNIPTFLSNKHYEVCKYYMLSDHNYIPDILLAGTKTMQRLSSSEKQLLKKAASMSAIYHKKIWEEAEREAFRIVEEAGVEIVAIQKNEFIKVAEKFYEEIESPHLQKIIQNIRINKHNND